MIQFLRYTFVSFAALAVDYVFYIFLINFTSLKAEIAASISYMIGLVLAYVLLKKFVFNFGVKHRVKVERILFYLSGLIGTITTYLVAKTSMFLYANPFIAKGNAVLVSFGIVYLFRKYYVFKKT
jgi:putative flippase GtrA